MVASPPIRILGGRGVSVGWRQVFTGKVEADGKEDVEQRTTTNGRVIDFDELAQLVRRPRRRQKPAPEGQMVLF